jgi:hypothetical protein
MHPYSGVLRCEKSRQGMNFASHLGLPVYAKWRSMGPGRFWMASEHRSEFLNFTYRTQPLTGDRSQQAA